MGFSLFIDGNFSGYNRLDIIGDYKAGKLK